MCKEIIGSCTLYHGDCFEIMRDITGTDCVITDPPYGCTCNKWDKPIDLELFWRLIDSASKEAAAQCVFCQMPFAADLYCANRKNFRYEYVYVKPKLVGYLDARKKPMRAHESIYIFYRSFPVYEPQMGNGRPYKKLRHGPSTNYGKVERRDVTYSDGKRFPTTLLEVEHDTCFYTAGFKPYPQHPTQKSVAAIAKLVKTYTLPGETVFDPFMGSGSTGVAAVRHGRSFIGIEQDKKWFETACQRVADEYQKRSLLELGNKDSAYGMV